MKNCIFDLLYDINQHGFDAYLVGGCVRDHVLNNVQSDDIDIATNAPSSTLLDIFKDLNPKCLKLDTIKFKYQGYSIDIAHFRKEALKGQLLDVSLVDNLLDDSLRRDFTINSLYMDRNKFIYFFNSSYEDCLSRTLRFLKDIRISLQEDSSRMIRYIYFILKYDLKYVDSEYTYILENADSIVSSIGKDLINKYIHKIAKDCDFKKSICFLKELNIYSSLFGDVKSSDFNDWNMFLKQFDK